MPVFLWNQERFTGGANQISVVRFCADTMDEWEEVKGLLQLKAKRTSWIVEPRDSHRADWMYRSKMLPYGKIRASEISVLKDNLEWAVVHTAYLQWFSQELKRQLVEDRHGVHPDASAYFDQKRQEIAFRAIQYGLIRNPEEIGSPEGAEVVDQVTYQIENLDLGRRRRLKLLNQHQKGEIELDFHVSAS